jgi:hypothetical protein
LTYSACLVEGLARPHAQQLRELSRHVQDFTQTPSGDRIGACPRFCSSDQGRAFVDPASSVGKPAAGRATRAALETRSQRDGMAALRLDGRPLRRDRQGPVGVIWLTCVTTAGVSTFAHCCAARRVRLHPV